MNQITIRSLMAFQVALRLIIGLGALVAIAGCSSGTSQTLAKTGPRRAIVCALDVSGSTKDPAVQQKAKDTILGLASGLCEGGTIVVIPATSNSQTAVLSSLSFTAPSRLPWENDLKFREAAYTATAQFSNQLTELLSHRSNDRGSDLVYALGTASTDLRAISGSLTKQSIYLFSDCIQQSGYLDLTREWLTPKRIDALVATLKQKGQIPSLTGADVWIVGFAAGETTLTPRKLQSIKSFWVAYFAASGATFSLDHFDAPTTCSQR